jgi:hypothetical protein
VTIQQTCHVDEGGIDRRPSSARRANNLVTEWPHASALRPRIADLTAFSAAWCDAKQAQS